jgi:Mg2+/citrate symporter
MIWLSGWRRPKMSWFNIALAIFVVTIIFCGEAPGFTCHLEVKTTLMLLPLTPSAMEI